MRQHQCLRGAQVGLSRGARRDRQGAREPWELRRRQCPCGPLVALPGGLRRGLCLRARPRPVPPTPRGVLSWPRRAEALGGTQGASGLSRGRGSSHPCPAHPCHPGLHFSSLIPLSLLTFRDPVSSWKPASLPTPTLRALLVLGPGFLCLQGTVALPCGLPEPSAPGQAIVSPN